MDPVELTDADIALRPWRTSDIDDAYHACQDPDIQRWTMVPSPYSVDDARRFISEFAPAQWRAGTGAPFGVFDAATGGLLGSCGLVRLDHDAGTAEIGYWTARPARGRRVAERAARLVARWALDDLGVSRLEWRAELGNQASRLVAARLGFRIEALERKGMRARGGGTVDGWVGALLSGELRDAGDDDADLRRAARQARTFGTGQPTLPAETAGGGTTLRPLTADDVPALVEICQDAEMIAFTTVPDPYLPEHAEGYLRHVARAWLSGTGTVFGIEVDGRLAGTVDLRLDEWWARIAEIGYSVAPWARGAGVASGAVRGACAWAFDALALDRVEWRAYTTNLASRRVAEKVGFTIEGTERSRLMHRGGPVDTWYGALLAGDL